ncbi:DUF3951 domain-containing protein [Bacillus solimangrovi]|uniref:DUF3951 domain-containing protein n=1 Tax=Bacillus solimangrovi TaxID=1305675 RepID=UPI001FE0ABD5|nr:DUF3951 domain-containing protein [Bacillus solimangrovi]
MIVFVVLILMVAYKVLIKKETPSNYYTPFDHIAGQATNEFQEENKEYEREEQNDEGNDIDKNI